MENKILIKVSHGQFKPEYQLTIGVEFSAKNIQIRNKIYRIQIWDTAGQENFRSITRAYYKNSVCALLVYDISNRETFEHISNWVEDCKAQSPKTVFMVLVGNKSDLQDKRQVNYKEGQELAERFQMLFFETSAKDGNNVEEIFLKSADEIAKKIDQGYYDLQNDTCGIKQGLNRQQNNQLHLNQNNANAGGRSGCC